MPDVYLEREIAAWRGRMTAALPGQSETIRELEEHLRDHLEALRRDGMSEAEALAVATRQLGDAAAVGREFRRAKTQWFGAAHSWEKKLLTYCVASLGLGGCLMFFSWSIRALTRVLSGKSFGPNPDLAVFWTVQGFALATTCALVVRAAGRFLERPTRGDARSIAAFALFAVWMLSGYALAGARFSYAVNVTVLVLALAGLFLFWRAWIANVMTSMAE